MLNVSILNNVLRNNEQKRINFTDFNLNNFKKNDFNWPIRFRQFRRIQFGARISRNQLESVWIIANRAGFLPELDPNLTRARCDRHHPISKSFGQCRATTPSNNNSSKQLLLLNYNNRLRLPPRSSSNNKFNNSNKQHCSKQHTVRNVSWKWRHVTHVGLILVKKRHNEIIWVTLHNNPPLYPGISNPTTRWLRFFCYKNQSLDVSGSYHDNPVKIIFPAAQSCSPILPIGSNPGRFVSQQSIHLNVKQSASTNQNQPQLPKTQKYVPPNKKQFNLKNANTNSNKTNEQNKQGPYNKVLIVGLSQEYRSLNGVLSKFYYYVIEVILWVNGSVFHRLFHWKRDWWNT